MYIKHAHVLASAIVLGIFVVAAHFVSASAADSRKAPQSSAFDGKFVTVTTSEGLVVTLEDARFVALNGGPMLLGSEVLTDPGIFRSTHVKTYLAWESVIRCVIKSEGMLGERQGLPQ